MKYYKANCDHSFYSQKGKLVFCLIKDELLTLKEIKRILCPHQFLIDKVISTISYVARFNKKNAKSEIEDICNNLKVQTVFRNYPIRELQKKKILISMLIRLKFSLGLNLLLKLKNK